MNRGFWEVQFSTGATNQIDLYTGPRPTLQPTERIRCVRGGAELSGEHYVIDGDTVFDAGTGLTWQRLARTSVSAPQADSYCADAALRGGDWRLPSMKELQTIVAEARANIIDVAIDPDVFPDTPIGWFWTSSQVAGHPTQRWGVDFRSGGSLPLDLESRPGYTNYFAARCVR